MKILKISIFFIPLIVLAFVLFFNPKDNTNKRLETFESSLANESEYPTETKEEITELETKILKEGDGSFEVEEGDNIVVNYRGWLAKDAVIFDDSFSRGNNGYALTVGENVIEGWSEGIVGMKKGEIRRLYIPSDLGYGEEGSGESIPANADLIFDVELIRIN